MFAQTLSETGNPFSPVQPTSSSSSAALGVFSTIAGLGDSFLKDAQRKFEKQDERDFRQAALMEQRQYDRSKLLEQRDFNAQQEVKDNDFLAPIYSNVSRIREAARQGRLTKIQEATYIRRATDQAYQQRPDLADVISRIDNDVAGINAGEVERDELYRNEELAQSIVDTELKANPHLVVFSESGSIDEAESFNNAMTVRRNKEQLEFTKQRVDLENAALQGTNLEFDIKKKQVDLLTQQAKTESMSQLTGMAKTSALSLMQHAKTAKQNGDYDPVVARQMLSEARGIMEQNVRDQMIAIGVNDAGEIKGAVEGVNSLFSSMLEMENAPLEAMEDTIKLMKGREDLDVLSRMPQIAALDRNFPGLMRPITEFAISRNNAQVDGIARDVGSEMFGNLDTYLKAASNPSINMSESVAATATPIVQHILSNPKFDSKTNLEAANMLSNWLPAVNAASERTAQALQTNLPALKQITNATARARIKSIAQTNPELFNDSIAPKMVKTMGLLMKSSSVALGQQSVYLTDNQIDLIPATDGTLTAIRSGTANSNNAALLASDMGLNSELIAALPEGDPLRAQLEQEVVTYTADLLSRSDDAVKSVVEDQVGGLIKDFNKTVTTMKELLPLAGYNDEQIKRIIDAYTPVSVKRPKPTNPTVEDNNGGEGDSPKPFQPLQQK